MMVRGWRLHGVLRFRFYPEPAFALEDIADSAGGRYGKIDVMIEQPHPQFLAPVRVFLTQGSQVSGDIIRNRPGVGAWRARPVRER